MKPRRNHLLLLGAISLTLATPSAFATTLYWDVNGTTAGFSTVIGAWNTGNFWNTDSTGGSGGTVTATTTGVDDLIIGPATTNTGTITLTGTKILKSLTFGTTVGAVTLSGTGTLSFAGGGGITVASTAGNQIISSGVTIAGNNTLNVGSGRSLTLNGTFTHSTGATLNVQSAANAVIFSPAANVNRIVAPWASFGTGTNTTYAAFSTGMVGLAYAASPSASQGTLVTLSTNVISTALPGTVNYSLNAAGTLGASASNLVVIPEPSAALLGGLGLLALLRRRRN